MLLDLMANGLRREGVTEFAVMSGRPPCVKQNGAYQPVAQYAVSAEELLELLLTLGGVSYVDALGSEAVTWRSVEDGLGSLSIQAAKRDGTIHARIVLQREARDAGSFDGPLTGRRVSPPAEAPAKARPAPPLPPLPPRAPAPQAPIEAAPAPSPPKAAPTPITQVIEIDRPKEGALFDHLLRQARRRNATDLHIVAGRPVLYRIAGELVPSGAPLGALEVEETLKPILPGRLVSTFERDGSCDFAIAHPELGRFRINVGRQRTGMKASLRLIGLELPTLASLGLPDAIGQATHHHQGLIVLTGPTGHGKTATLAALVNLLNTDTTHHIITVEDPVEHIHPRKRALISQREVGSHTRSFASALKASLREDPDVIVVGELRDTETVKMALAASETGHLVIATMNTPSAAKTIDRLIDLFPPGDQPQVRMALAGGLRLIVSQRLLRSTDGARVHAAAEVLPGSIALWNIIREGKTFQIPSLQQRGKAAGITRLDDSLADLVRAGKVSLDEARTVAEAPEELAQTLAGQKANAAPRKAG